VRTKQAPNPLSHLAPGSLCTARYGARSDDHQSVGQRFPASAGSVNTGGALAHAARAVPKPTALKGIAANGTAGVPHLLSRQVLRRNAGVVLCKRRGFERDAALATAKGQHGLHIRFQNGVGFWEPHMSESQVPLARERERERESSEVESILCPRGFVQCTEITLNHHTRSSLQCLCRKRHRLLFCQGPPALHSARKSYAACIRTCSIMMAALQRLKAGRSARHAVEQHPAFHAGAGAAGKGGSPQRSGRNSSRLASTSSAPRVSAASSCGSGTMTTDLRASQGRASAAPQLPAAPVHRPLPGIASARAQASASDILAL